MANRRNSRSNTPKYPRSARVSTTLQEIIADELVRIDDERLTFVTVTGIVTMTVNFVIVVGMLTVLLATVIVTTTVNFVLVMVTVLMATVIVIVDGLVLTLLKDTIQMITMFMSVGPHYPRGTPLKQNMNAMHAFVQLRRHPPQKAHGSQSATTPLPVISHLLRHPCKALPMP